MICPHCGMKIEPKKKEKKVFDHESREYKASLYLLICIRKNDEKFRIDRDEETLQGFAQDIDLILRSDKRSPEDLKKAIDFATTDDFWKKNILSAKSLRKQFSRLMIVTKEKHGASGPSTIYRKLNGNTPNQ